MTLEDLAVMVKRGFDTMATKDDLKEIWEELNATHADVRYIRSTADALVHSDIAQEGVI